LNHKTIFFLVLNSLLKDIFKKLNQTKISETPNPTRSLLILGVRAGGRAFARVIHGRASNFTELEITEKVTSEVASLGGTNKL